MLAPSNLDTSSWLLNMPPRKAVCLCTLKGVPFSFSFFMMRTEASRFSTTPVALMRQDCSSVTQSLVATYTVQLAMTERERDRHSTKQRDRQTDRRQTDRQTETGLQQGLVVTRTVQPTAKDRERQAQQDAERGRQGDRRADRDRDRTAAGSHRAWWSHSVQPIKTQKEKGTARQRQTDKQTKDRQTDRQTDKQQRCLRLQASHTIADESLVTLKYCNHWVYAITHRHTAGSTSNCFAK